MRGGGEEVPVESVELRFRLERLGLGFGSGLSSRELAGLGSKLVRLESGMGSLFLFLLTGSGAPRSTVLVNSPSSLRLPGGIGRADSTSNTREDSLTGSFSLVGARCELSRSVTKDVPGENRTDGGLRRASFAWTI